MNHHKQGAVKSLPRVCTAVLIGLVCITASEAVTVYQNTFDDTGSLSDFTVYGEEFTGYNPPPLHEVSIDSGQLRIDTDYLRPNGSSSPPVLMGRAFLSVDTSTTFGPVYDPVLSNNSGLISWSFNISNREDMWNNTFSCVLASTKADPYDTAGGFAQGYTFNGGGMVGNRMAIRRFDYGMGGGGEMLVDITNGLGTLPEKGSIRITFDPATAEWALYAETGPAYADPTQVTTLLGTAVDATYTGMETRYFGLLSGNNGTTYFDNVSVDVVPEPASIVCMLFAAGGAGFIRRRFCI